MRLLSVYFLWRALLFLVLVLPLPIFAKHNIELPEVGSIGKIKCLHYRFEKAQLSAKDVLKKKFQTFCGASPDFGFRSEYLWIRLDIQNHSFLAKSFWLLLENSRIAKMDVFLLDAKGQKIATFSEGYKRPVSYKSIKASFPAIWIEFPPHSQNVCLIRLQSPFPYGLNFHLLNDADFHSFLWRQYFFLGFFYGLMFLSFLSVFLAYFSLRYRFLLWATGVVLFQSLFLLSHDGLWYYFRDMLKSSTETCVLFGQASLSFGNVFVNLLIQSLSGLEYKKNKKLFVLLHLSTVFYVFIGISAFLSWSVALRAFGLLSIYSTILLSYLMFFYLRQGKPYLRFLIFTILPNFIRMFLGFSNKYFGTNFSPFERWFHWQIAFAYLAFILTVLDYLLFHRKREKERIEEGIRKQTAELRLAKHRAEESNRFKEELLRMVSHDLRSPLLALKTTLPFLVSGPSRKQAGDSSMKSPSIEGPIEEIYNQSTKTIDGLLSYIDYVLADSDSPIDDWKLDLKYHPLREIVEEVTTQNGLLLASKQIKLQLELLPVEWFLDKELTLRMLGNLVDNSIKFSKKGGRIWIEMPDEGRLLIRDEGLGIHPKEQALFHAGKRLPSRQGTEGEKGSGLGLAYAKILVEIQGGAITMQNAPKGGLQIQIRWPKEQCRMLSNKGLFSRGI